MNEQQVNYLLSMVLDIFSPTDYLTNCIITAVSYLSFEDKFKTKYSDYFDGSHCNFCFYNKTKNFFGFAKWYGLKGFTTFSKDISPVTFFEALDKKPILRRKCEDKFSGEIAKRLTAIKNVMIDDYVKQEMMKHDLL